MYTGVYWLVERHYLSQQGCPSPAQTNCSSLSTQLHLSFTGTYDTGRKPAPTLPDQERTLQTKTPLSGDMGDWSLLPCRWHSRAYLVKVPVPNYRAPFSLAFMDSCNHLLAQTNLFLRASSLLVPFEELAPSWRGPRSKHASSHLPSHLPLFLRAKQISKAYLEKSCERQTLYRLLPLLSLKTMYSGLHAPFLPLCISFTLLNRGAQAPSRCRTHIRKSLTHFRGFATWRKRNSEASKVLEEIAWGESVIFITEAFQSRNKQIFVKNGLGRVDPVSEQQTDLQVCSSLIVYASVIVIAVVTYSAIELSKASWRPYGSSSGLKLLTGKEAHVQY